MTKYLTESGLRGRLLGLPWLPAHHGRKAKQQAPEAAAHIPSVVRELRERMLDAAAQPTISHFPFYLIKIHRMVLAMFKKAFSCN